MKLHKSSKEKEVFYYFTTKNEKLWLYRHRYYDPVTGKRKEKRAQGFKTEKAAIQALMEVKAQTLRNETKSLENDNITVAQWFEIWYETNCKKWKESTCAQREMIIRRHIEPLLGHYKLKRLDRLVYQREFIDVLERGYKPGTVRLFHNIFKIGINAAVDEEILTRNRFTKVTFAYHEESEEQVNGNYLEPNELKQLLQTAKETEDLTNYSCLLTFAYTGLRRGEVCGLQWKNIDFENRTITVERTRDRNTGVRSPKTKNSYRTILVTDMLIKQLKTYQTWCKQIMLANGKRYTDSAFVFISPFGEPVNDDTVAQTFKRVQRAAGLTHKDENGKTVYKCTLHGLRHTHATMLLNGKQDVKVIAERLGNTPAMIYDVYGHILKELEQESVNTFDAMLDLSAASNGEK